MEFEELVESLVGTDVTFSIDGKVIKKGHVENVEFKVFLARMDLLEADGKIRRFDFPIPFEFQIKDDVVTLDYCIESIKTLTKLDEVDRIAAANEVPNPLYDSRLTLKISRNI